MHHSHAQHDVDAHLQSLGYVAELTRNRSTFQVAFMSFVLASIPYGLATTLLYPLTGGGSTDVIWGWLVVSLIIMCVAASLGEITSVFPTAGGVYYQTYMLSPTWCRRITAWICGWNSVIGQVTITLAVNFGTTLFFIGCINVFTDSAGNPIFAATTYQTFLVFVGLTIFCNLVCALANRWLPILDTFAIFWTFAGVLALIITILVLAKGGRRDAKFVFTDFTPQSGWPSGWSWMVGLLHAAYATSSTGMIINMAEEVKDPARQIPVAMLGTIILNTIIGLVFLIPLMFVLPADVASLILNAQPVPVIVSNAVGNQTGSFLLLLPLMVLAVICGIGCTTAASRCIWSFARDGAVPGFQLWSQVNRKLDVPLNAMMLSMVVQILLGAIYFGSYAAYNAFSGVGVISLTLSYGMPIIISLLEGRTHVKSGRFYLGKLGFFCNIVAVAWTALAIPLFSMPSAIPVTAQSVNYAPVVFVGFLAISGIWYLVYGKSHYAGPPAADSEIAAAVVSDAKHPHSGYDHKHL
ncbi:amino acid transporter [Myriangium duriaei CBS 260.36]|uniref:Amino acid transporter n=1 Tax=Myriangium duriaei CBS 260.36 TaxID=1168546 RepID=A0A9P4MLF7_9PEZI|nr:amino acid transporter [Myriangium duriaei CBS 260.36]